MKLKFFPAVPSLPATPLSKRRRICHNEVVEGNLSMRRVLGVELADSGSTNATDTGTADRDACTNDSFAPGERPARFIVRERSTGLSLTLVRYVRHCPLLNVAERTR